MNNILNATASASLSSSYEAPTAEPVGVTMEGILCASGDHEGWGTDDDLWN